MNFRFARAMLARINEERRRPMLQDLTWESFRPHLNETFHVSIEDGRLDLELTEVERLGAAKDQAAGRAPFSLVFRGPEEAFLEQRTHAIEHEALGRLELFMVPIGQNEGGFLYQVIFT